MRLIDFMRMIQKRQRLLSLLCFCSLLSLFAACVSQQSAGGDPAAAVESYLDAMVRNETDRLPSLVCPAYEAGARTDFDSFGAIGGVTLEGVDCTTASTTGDSATVTCTGSINFTYNGEANSQELTGTTYAVQRVDGAWTMCGYS